MVVIEDEMLFKRDWQKASSSCSVAPSLRRKRISVIMSRQWQMTNSMTVRPR